jgi:hypothetical protein
MRVQQKIIRKPADLAAQVATLAAIDPDLLIVFGSVAHLTAPEFSDTLRAAAPRALQLGCTTAGEISPQGVDDNSCTVTAVHFDRVRLTSGSVQLASMDDSFAAGERLGRQLAAADLNAILVFGPGVQINGSALVDGMTRVVGTAVPITGGLAGDGGAFRQTFTLGSAGVTDNHIVAVGLCGEGLTFGHGSFGGWEAFGPARRVTRCAGNVLFELDGEPALDVYKRYLGDHAKELPASGLLFPFAILGEDHNEIGLLRTILGIDEANGSLTLAGEISANSFLKLMHASTDKLVNGAEAAAEAAQNMIGRPDQSVAILVSCVGRKLVMGGRVDEEVEAVGEVFGSKAVLTGFYSYGEISPFAPGGTCKLHNQTMTITSISEK